MRAILFLFLFAPALVLAVTVKPIGVRTVYTDVNGTTHYADVITKMTSQTYGTQYTIKKVPISLSTLGKLARAAMRGPVGLSITAALMLKDIFYNEQSDTFVSPADFCPPGFEAACARTDGAWSVVNKDFPDLASALGFYLSADCNVSGCVNLSMWEFDELRPGTGDLPSFSIRMQGITDNSYKFDTTSIGFYPGATPDQGNYEVPGDMFSDTDVGQQFSDSVQSGEFPPDIISDIANSSVSSGGWVDDWPELQAQVTNDIAALTQADAGTSPYSPAEEAAMKDEAATGIELQKQMADDLDAMRKQQEQEQENELPLVPPLPTQLPIDNEVIDLPSLSTSEITSSVSGVCPPPITFVAMGETYAVEYTPVCDLATTMRPFLVALGWLVAAFVAFGQSKSVG